MKKLIIALLFFPLFIFGQQQTTSDLFSLKAGYNGTNVKVKDAIGTKNFLFGNTFGSGKVFSGAGVHFGLLKNLTENLRLELNTSLFKGSETTSSGTNNQGNYEQYYHLKGFTIPVTVNYLFRKETRRLRPFIGTGLQYLHFSLQQFEDLQSTTTTSKTQLNDIENGEIQFLLTPGVQLRIVNSLFVSFQADLGLSKNRSDGGNLSLIYTFKK